MSAQLTKLDSPSRESISAQNSAQDASSRLDSPSDTSRQTRKLQLRNAGFRGAAVPTRNISPKSISSTNWSTTSWMNTSSDVENVSPAGARMRPLTVERRESGGILQDIGNSAVTQRSRRARQHAISNKTTEPGDQSPGVPGRITPDSPPALPKSTIRQRSIKSKAKISHRKRSVSAETSKYIEHLESELASAQSQLSSITSPSVTREQTSRMRTLNVEIKQLQEQLLEWESKFEERVQEEVDKHITVECDLRARIRHLEQDGGDAQLRIHQLEAQVETTSQSMQVVEAANSNLEKRLEIMSELLASTKVDLHAETPGRGRRHIRPKSMLPRFPTASSLMGSPERQSHTQPTSPLSFIRPHPGHGILDSSMNSIIHNEHSPDQSDFFSEAESIFSEDSAATCDSMTSAENFDSQPSFNPWSTNIRQPADKTKPARRMRRFGAGSFGPKPLILPRASQRGQYPPLSAPPLEHSKTTPSFFPARSVTSDDSGSPVSGRRRASTTANELTLSVAAKSSFLDIPEQSIIDDSLLGSASPPSARSDLTTRRFSLAELPTGRNLMEELSAARSKRDSDSVNLSSESRGANSFFENKGSTPRIDDQAVEASSLPIAESTEYIGTTDLSNTTLDHTSPPSIPKITSARSHHHRTRSRSISIPMRCTQSAFTRLRILFGDLWKSPVAVARYLIHTVQSRMQTPRSLINVQWWLVGVLLGPMAKRRLLATPPCQRDLEDETRVLADTPTRSTGSDGLAYGTFDSTPSTLPTRKASGIAGKDRKRAGSRAVCSHQRRGKHSPWLWIKFSITLAFAIGVAFKDGPGSMLNTGACRCIRRARSESREDDALVK